MVEFSFQGLQERSDHPALRESWLQSHALSEQLRGTSGSVSMRCGVCGADQRLLQSDDWREGMRCERCGLSARLRSSVTLLRQFCAPDQPLYCTEQATALYVRLQQEWRQVQGSEFAPTAAQRETLARYLRELGGRGGVNFQDVTRLTWEDASFKAVYSGDVLEHVPDYRAALGEFHRVLRPSGVLIATYPFTDGASTVVRAEVTGSGEIVHLLPPEYHGDPISGGVLCFYHFGWDILDEVRAAGFSEAHMVMPWDPEGGVYFGNWTLIARR
ncbi:MAG: class I SAM-dependent methyltransferase [Pseudoxanthomonas sp.]|nr:class I SAM-dependent methyltransferase [Pseudoxanthomonas sp.]